MSDVQANSSHDPIPSANGTLELVTKAAQDGAADAREAAARTWTAAGRFMSRFIYTTCYTVSYGVVFPTVFLARSIPVNNAAVRGLVEGSHAAWRKVDELYPEGSESSPDAATPALAPA